MLFTIALILIFGGSCLMFIFFPLNTAFALFLAGSALYLLGLVLLAVGESRRRKQMTDLDQYRNDKNSSDT